MSRNGVGRIEEPFQTQMIPSWLTTKRRGVPSSGSMKAVTASPLSGRSAAEMSVVMPKFEVGGVQAPQLASEQTDTAFAAAGSARARIAAGPSRFEIETLQKFIRLSLSAERILSSRAPFSERK